MFIKLICIRQYETSYGYEGVWMWEGDKDIYFVNFNKELNIILKEETKNVTN